MRVKRVIGKKRWWMRKRARQGGETLLIVLRVGCEEGKMEGRERESNSTCMYACKGQRGRGAL